MITTRGSRNWTAVVTRVNLTGDSQQAGWVGGRQYIPNSVLDEEGLAVCPILVRAEIFLCLFVCCQNVRLLKIFGFSIFV